MGAHNRMSSSAARQLFRSHLVGNMSTVDHRFRFDLPLDYWRN